MRLALESALTFAPFLALLALLLRRRFVGEDRIVARRMRHGMRLRPARVRWGRPLPAAARASVFARAPRCLRGPPALA